MTALIDGDIIVYRCAAAMKKTEYCLVSEDGDTVLRAVGKRKFDKEVAALGLSEEELSKCSIEISEVYDDIALGRYSVREMISRITEETDNTKYRLFVTGDDNFRIKLATIAGYKANRPSRPRFYQEIKDYLWSLPGVEVSSGCEADDLIGMAATEDPTSIICSLDKDLDMIPGHHYDFVRKMQYYITPEEGLANFYRQILTGDDVDNIKGINGVGPKRAAAIIREGMTEEEMFEACLRRYLTEYLSQLKQPDEKEREDSISLALSHVVENGKLLWIWRTPGIWNPPVDLDRARDMMRSMIDVA